MVFSSVMRLHPSSPHPLVESCLSSLERHLEKERHPQTLFLLLSYYRLRAQALQGHAASDQQLINNRKILRLVRHTLGQVSAMREHELALLDEMLALCAQEANNKALEAIFSSQLFYENRQERFIRSMAEWLPRKAENLTPYTMALIAKYVARHRLREPRLLGTIANFLPNGPRLDPRYRVLMFEHALTADEANRKYSYKGLVAEALRQLVGEECYRQDEVLPPGYCT
ncbi:PREDICTED: fas-activated serine/threonine kinase, partial [Acanthisitta chloris]|uniref:fas-activated serine/threonine kinase n=1 Tax=Acanthisitta chloris TaxID=57068 RepID=UPI0004F0CE6A